MQQRTGSCDKVCCKTSPLARCTDGIVIKRTFSIGCLVFRGGTWCLEHGAHKKVRTGRWGVKRRLGATQRKR